MTREEAITVLEGLSNNPLFSNQHKAAFNIAIHDIKAYHDWDINNLILINKENCEPLEQEPILDTIRAKIDKIYEREGSSFDCLNALDELKEFIDRYKTEDEGFENKLKDLSERVENIEKQMKDDKEEQLKNLKAELDYAKFRCTL